jgi:zinc transport system substrate-binding protein
MRKVLFMVLALAACLGADALVARAAQADALKVAVGVAPVEYFAKIIGGGHVQTVVLVPAGADAHTYEPKPSQMRELSRCALYLSAGLEFETAWEPRLKAANPKLGFVRLDQGLALMPMPEGHDDHNKGAHRKDAHGHKAKAGHGHDEESDPHIWVSPANVRHMAAMIAEAFSRADPSQAKAYSANLAAFLMEIDALDAELRAVFAGVPADRRGFLVFHPAWGYLARDYGLTQTAIEFEGKEPSPRRLGALIAQAKALGVKVIFVQPQMSRRTAESIAQAIGARVLVVDPLAADWAANLRVVGGAFRAALR